MGNKTACQLDFADGEVKMDRHIFLSTLLSVVILIASTVGNEHTDERSCPEHQTAFDGSCYEFVTQKHSFMSAENWCEQGGGHLAFIENDQTQQFLQTNLLAEQNWWFGLAYTSFNQDSSKGKRAPLTVERT